MPKTQLHFLINLNPLHCLGMKLLTDTLNLLNAYFANSERRKNAMKKIVQMLKGW